MREIYAMICMLGHLKPLPKDKMLDFPKLKAFADNNIKVIKKWKFVLGWVETLWKKEKMLVVTSIFSFSHNVFEMLLHNFTVRKSRDCALKG